MLNQVPFSLEDHRDMERLDLREFPEARNFEIELYRSEWGHRMRFRDSELGAVIEFPWWDDVDTDLRRRSLADVPMGTATAPYTDEEQAWRILIWRSGDEVYVMQGDHELFHIWFRVPVGDYLNQWAAVLGRSG